MRFNEAPAERGGKPRYRVGAPGSSQKASMRPPLNAGENMPCKNAPRKRTRSFNEAPAERGGKPGRTVRHRQEIAQGFNEAPAERGGKPVTVPSASGTLSSFNEAPAERGGKPAPGCGGG